MADCDEHVDSCRRKDGDCKRGCRTRGHGLVQGDLDGFTWREELQRVDVLAGEPQTVVDVLACGCKRRRASAPNDIAHLNVSPDLEQCRAVERMVGRFDAGGVTDPDVPAELAVPGLLR